MSQVAIRIDGLGKEYQLGRVAETYPTLREALARGASRTVRAVGALAHGRSARRAPERFWALRDVTLEIGQGEVVGIIGRNGAGKSTLLKLLARVTEPTVGSAQLVGRLGSLLEVGTGFHPELTGRENTYLNGAILGMPRREIARKFDEIVAFAEVERFIDTPVKHYSSGMYLRLAFAVAAHLEPEILLVDEVLAVGDAAFQKKCIGKMSEVSQHGRTVLFVSHNMDAVQRLCTRAILLEQGEIALDGAVPQVVSRYLSARLEGAAPGQWTRLDDADRSGSGEARFAAVRYTSDSAAAGGFPHPGGPLTVELEVRAPAALAVDSLAVVIWSPGGMKLVNADTLSIGRRLQLGDGTSRVTLRIAELHLNPGTYRLGLWLANLEEPYDYIESALSFEVAPSSEADLGVTPRKDGLIPCRFEVVGDSFRSD